LHLDTLNLAGSVHCERNILGYDITCWSSLLTEDIVTAREALNEIVLSSSELVR
jgi:hypothetical protein